MHASGGNPRPCVAILALTAILLTPLLARASQAPPKPVASSGRADSYYLYCLSQQALLQRDYGRALRYLEESAKTDPNSPLLAAELARAYLNLNEVDRAIDEASRAIALDPAAVEAKRTLAEAYRVRVASSGEVDEALFARSVAAHSDLIAADPTDGEARLSLARLYLSHGLHMQAAEILKAHLAAESDSIEAVYLLAQALLRSGSVEEARTLLDKALLTHPSQPDLRRSLAEALDAEGDVDGAVRIMQDLVNAHPDHYMYRLSLGRLLMRAKQYSAAAAEAKTVIRAVRGSGAGSLEPSDLRAAYMILIDATVASGDADQAIATVLRAEREIPSEVRFTLKRAEILLFLGREAEAEAALAAATSRPEPSRASTQAVADIYVRAASRREQQGDFNRAEELLRRAIEIDPSNHAAMNYLGYMFADRGVSLAQALALTSKAVEMDADNGAYLDSLGWTLFRLGRYAEAMDPLMRAAKLIPGEPVVRDHLGDLYRALSRMDDAARSWEEALRLGAGNAEAIRAKIREARSPQPVTP